MKRDHFEDLKEVVACLMPNEVRTARKFITAFEGNATKGKNKSLLLFELILADPDIIIEQAAKRIGPNNKKNALNKLASRLRNKLVESLILSVNLDHEENNSNRTKIKFEIRKQLMYAGICSGRGLKSQAVVTYEGVIDKARKYEFYTELLEALELKRGIIGLRRGYQEYQNYSKDILFYKKCQEALSSSNAWYFKHFTMVDRRGLKKEDITILNGAIKKIEIWYTDTKSANVGYLLYTLTMEYLLALEEYKKSCEIGKKLIGLVTNNIWLFNRIMIGGSYANLADCYIFIFDFHSSIRNSNWALGIFNPLSIEAHVVVKETLFRDFYYLGELTLAISIATEIAKNTNPNNSPFHHAKRVYLKACAHFAQGEFKEALQNLHTTKEIENDKEGWNIGKRLLTILIYLELGDWDAAETGITNLRMHIQRLKPKGTVRQRDTIILKVLQKLVFASFDYPQVLDKHPDLFELLDRTDRDYRWQVKSPEMVVFHHWFQDKAQGIPYQFRVPEPLMKKFGAKSPGRDLDFPVK